MIKHQHALLWMRRDLRLNDHVALYHACQQAKKVSLVFVFDDAILQPLKQKSAYDRRLQFICESLADLQKDLMPYNSQIILLRGKPLDEISRFCKQNHIDALYFNRDYSQYPRKRDAAVIKCLKSLNIISYTFQDHVLVEPDKLYNQQQKPYHVFTPYSKAWHRIMHTQKVTHYEPNLNVCAPVNNQACKLSDILAFSGFKQTPSFLKGGSSEALKHLKTFASSISNYDRVRNYPDLDQTSKLSVYLRHGCVSIRQLYIFAQQHASTGSDTWINELIWREFYQMIAYHYPHIKTGAFKEKYQNLQYPNDDIHLEAWKQGQTGFPIIDAAMRCLNQTGWMHNRLRMLTASFLCKLALVHWRLGERYFAWKLLDYEFASNNGGWQWASGTGCDAAPYFRIFNPETQSKTYDKEGRFIAKYCPELAKFSAKDIHNPPAHLRRYYPLPIINYKQNRERALALYKALDSQ